MLKSPDKSIIPKMKKIIGKCLTYRELCSALDLPVKSSRSIPSQIKTLEIYCDIEVIKVKRPTKYRIIRVFKPKQDSLPPHWNDEQKSGKKKKVEELTIEEVIESNSKSKYQILFERILYYVMKKRMNSPLYLTGGSLLFQLSVVNSNFFIVRDKDKIKYLPEYRILNGMQGIVYKKLREWVISKIDKMEERGYISKKEGYKLYKKIDFDKYYFYDVEVGSQDHLRCQKIYNEAYEEASQGKWNKRNKNNQWIPKDGLEVFERVLSSKVKKEYNNEYHSLKKAMVIQIINFNSNSQRLSKKEERELFLCEKAIKEESGRKIRKTTQLKEWDDKTKELFISCVIDNTPIDFERLYLRKKAEIEKTYNKTLKEIAKANGQTLQEAKEFVIEWALKDE